MAKTASKQSPRKPSNNVISLASHREKNGKAFSLDELVRIENANREQHPTPKAAYVSSLQFMALLMAVRAVDGETYGALIILFDRETKACKFTIGGNIMDMPANLYKELAKCTSSFGRQEGFAV